MQGARTNDDQQATRDARGRARRRCVLPSAFREALLVTLAFLLLPAWAIAGVMEEMVDIVNWDSTELYHESTSRGVMLSPQGIVLEDRILVEDDAPAFGYSRVGNSEIISGEIVLRKHLELDIWPVPEARIVMLVYPHEPAFPNNGRHLVFTVNGNEDLVYEVNHFWTAVLVPADHLRHGRNTIDVRVLEEDAAFRTLIALDQHYATGSTTRTGAPGRSLRSTDGGRTWQDKQLGVENNSVGEYPIRLSLHARTPKGSLVTPVMDMGGSLTSDGLLQPVRIHALDVALAVQTPAGTSSSLLHRSGNTPVPDAEEWSEWEQFALESHLNEPPTNRFIQLRIDLESVRGDATPTIEGLRVSVKARPTSPGILDALRVHRLESRPIIPSSFDFQSEDGTHPSLQEFRSRHELNRVVAAGRTEFERIQLLKSWVAGLWDWYLPGKDYADFSAWDARRILEPSEPSQPKGGYCLQYAIVFAQACQSLGFPARVVSANYSIWGGHEMTEVWSNDYAKWILMDPQFDTVFLDKATGIPLNALELHEVLLREYFEEGEVINRDHWPREDMVRRAQTRSLEELPVMALIGGGAQSGALRSYNWWKPTVDLSAYCGGYGMFNLAEVRFLPRSNFMSQPLPMPLNHGLGSHWGWDGYLCWYSDQVPRTQEHKIFSDRPSDFYPVLNSVGITPTATASDTITLDLQTQSPSFGHYVILDNLLEVETTGAQYEWNIAPGLNRLTVQVVDKLGNHGPLSFLEVSRLE